MNAQNTVGNILKELGKLGTPSTKRMLMNNHGIKEPCFGVKIGDMKPIVKRIESDYQLALDLYATGNYDAMYLAGLIAEDERMTKKDLQQWAKKVYLGNNQCKTPSIKDCIIKVEQRGSLGKKRKNIKC